MRRLPILVALLLVACAPAAHGATYYVSPKGSDGASGLAGHPWRTLARLDRASLHSGDVVRLRGGVTYAGALTPSASGVTFESYGGGRAGIAGGIWFASVHDLTFRRLAVKHTDISAVQGSEQGSGSTHITIDDCVFTNVRIGINSANPNDGYWLVKNTLVRHTRDSGVIVVGHDMTFAHDRILDTGEDSSITYPKHGVYAKGPSLTFEHDVIRGFETDGISLRYRDATIEHTTISGGRIGIAFFEEDSNAGTTHIAHNHITDVSTAGIYVSPADVAGPTRESFVISNNVAGKIDAHTNGTLKLSGNR